MSLLYVDPTWSKVVPNIARGFEQSSDGKTLTVQLRRGMKWSDGTPFTADDILFWYEDIYLNKQIFPGKSPDLLIAGKDVVIQKVDQYTVRFVSPEPNTLLVERLASPLSDVGGPAIRGQLARGGFAPKHYLSKFHPKYAGQETVDKLAAEAKHSGWVTFFHDRNNWRINTELPVVSPWKFTVPASDASQMVVERNPYSIWVDTDGNQLPYIGTIRHTLAENTEIVTLRVTAGEYDTAELLDVRSLTVVVGAQDRGGYKTYLDPEAAGVGIALNLGYQEDPEVGDWLRNVDFRRALSLAVDRAQINEAIFLGTGATGSVAPAKENKYFPGEEWRAKWSTLDVAQANQLLDKAGLTQKDADGYRLRKDGKGRLRLSFVAAPRGYDFAALGEMLKQHWQKIGIDLSIDTVTATLLSQRVAANQVQMTGNAVGSEDVFLQPVTLSPQTGGIAAILGLPYAQWQATGGKQGKEPFPAIKEIMDLVEQGKTAPEKDRIELGKQIIRQHVDNVFSIGLVIGVPGVRIAKTTLGNVPGRAVNAVSLLSPQNTSPQTFYFK
jgi:peptide/nickel transport system substrate-binding protein